MKRWLIILYFLGIWLLGTLEEIFFGKLEKKPSDRELKKNRGMERKKDPKSGEEQNQNPDSESRTS